MRPTDESPSASRTRPGHLRCRRNSASCAAAAHKLLHLLGMLCCAQPSFTLYERFAVLPIVVAVVLVLCPRPHRRFCSTECLLAQTPKTPPPPGTSGGICHLPRRDVAEPDRLPPRSPPLQLPCCCCCERLGLRCSLHCILLLLCSGISSSWTLTSSGRSSPSLPPPRTLPPFPPRGRPTSLLLPSLTMMPGVLCRRRTYAV